MWGYAASCVNIGALSVGLLFWKEGTRLCQFSLLPNVVYSATAGHKSDSAGSGNVTYRMLAAMFFSDTKEFLNFTKLSWFIFPQALRVSQDSLMTLLRNLLCVRGRGLGRRLALLSLMGMKPSLLPQTAGHIQSKPEEFHSKMGYPAMEMEIDWILDPRNC